MSEGNGKRERSEAFQTSIQLLHEGRSAEAMELLESLYEQNPGDIEVAMNLGGAYILQQRYQDARAVLETAARADPDNANIWVNLAAARLGPLEESNRAQQDDAIAAYERALAVRPDVVNVHYMLGLIYRARQDNLHAAAHFARALEQNPNDNDARRMLAAIAAESEQR